MTVPICECDLALGRSCRDTNAGPPPIALLGGPKIRLLRETVTSGDGSPTEACPRPKSDGSALKEGGSARNLGAARNTLHYRSRLTFISGRASLEGPRPQRQLAESSRSDYPREATAQPPARRSGRRP